MNFSTAPKARSLMERVSPRFTPPQLQALQEWQAVKHLGSGATAEVWLLENSLQGHQVAAKIPRIPETVSELSHEAKLAWQLSHENIIQPIDPHDHPELNTLLPGDVTLWEFMAGGTLSGLIEATGPLGLPQVVTVILPMAQVTQYLHTRQIVHGDISPRNIMFDLSGRPVLIDFGSTRATAHNHVRAGTPGFVAPELLAPREEITGLGAGADVYALAAVAWFCLTGAIPGSAAHRVPLTTLQPELDLEIVDLLEACLNVRPELRPNLDRFITAVAHWAAPKPVDLHASVGEDYALMLPTRQLQENLPHRRSLRLRKSSIIQQAPAVKSQSLHRPAGKRIQRTLLAVGSLVLAAGVLFTATYVPHQQAQDAAAVEEGTAGNDQEDFQAVVDRLAKARTAAWTSADPQRVVQYALTESPVFDEDTAALSALADTRHSLDGIRMRAVVHSVNHSTSGTILEVTWRIEAYTQRDATGKSIRKMESLEEQLQLEVAETPDGWRMVAVL